MRVNRKPAAIYTEHDGRFIEKSFKDYNKLKTHLPHMISRAKDGVVSVYRTRTGQWGEWFEDWCKGEDGKLRIQKQGWM